MKKILLSLGSIIFVSTLLISGTKAFFGNPNTSTGNTFATGVITLKVDNESYVTNNVGDLVMSTSTSWALSSLAGKLFFNFLDLKPGDVGEDTISLHVSGNNAWACMNVALKSTPENGQDEPELIIDPTTGTNDGELQNHLYFSFWADDGDNVHETDEQTFKKGLVKDIFNNQNWALADSQNNIWGSPGPLPANTIRYIGKAWCFGTMIETPRPQDTQGKTGTNGPLVRGTGFSCNGVDVGNIAQSDGIVADVSFGVLQERSSTSFLCTSKNYQLSPTGTSTLFSENFNSAKLDTEFSNIYTPKWDQSGGVQGSYGGNPYGKVADLDAGSNLYPPDHTEVLTSKNVSTLGYHSITLKYDRRVIAPLGAPMTLTVDYSPNGGSTWTTLEVVSTSSPWTNKTWSLSPSADNVSQLKIRFSIVGTDGTDHAYIDNVTVTGVSP